MSKHTNGGIAADLLEWFDRTRRDLPWRHNKDPYRIWLSEIMLQQTQVQTVIPYFEAFLRRWPTLADLAAADQTEVLKAWEGLGYYSRARNLLAAAKLMQAQHGARVPADEKMLLALPGIGEYTAAAIGAIAFGWPVVAVDGNIVRVFARLTATAWQPADLAQRREVRKLAEAALPPDRAGDFNEALMDLGATVCSANGQPLCGSCPLAAHCLALQSDTVSLYPARPVAKARPAETRVVLAMMYEKKVRVRQRPAKGLLAGLYEFDWLDMTAMLPDESVPQTIARLFPGAVVSELGSLTHDFTHLRWLMTGYLICCSEPLAGQWANAEELAELPFPTALAGFREKVLALL